MKGNVFIVVEGRKPRRSGGKGGETAGIIPHRALGDLAILSGKTAVGKGTRTQGRGEGGREAKESVLSLW